MRGMASLSQERAAVRLHTPQPIPPVAPPVQPPPAPPEPIDPPQPHPPVEEPPGPLMRSRRFLEGAFESKGVKP